MDRPTPRSSLRIAFFTDTWYPSHNGVVTSTETFRRELQELGHQVHVFAPATPDTPKEPGVTRVASVPFPTEPNCRVALPFPRSLLVRFTRSRFDVIHTQTPFGLGLWGAALARMFRSPLVHTYHTFFAEYAHYLRVREDVGRAFVAQYSRLYCNRARAIVVPSPEFIDVLRSYRVTARIEVIPTGIRTPEAPPSREEARTRLGVEPGEKLLLFVGRLAKEKSIDFLLDVFRTLAAGEPAARFVLVGDGPHRAALEQKVTALGLAGRVRFTGARPHAEVWSWYAASDLFVFASRTETQGLVVAEALSAGLPVVAVRGPGVRDFVRPETGGVLVENDPAEFLAAVRHFLSDSVAHAEASALGRAAAVEWSSRRQAEKLVELYRRALRRPARRRILRRALARVATIGGRYRRSATA
jgi:1,2-diacylglycerol 3-alpha-glucosyltransferase